ncbi:MULTISPECIES: hypothetical protein [Galbibacter]|uniref:Lipoprotein n=1 Tax=Galbibacter pacificus TaxID=2996052 RepID=A0ABT6FQ78_9FLAO|nr:hypothetical protein [Galbibacter pacificus]MDG3582232.1 hypothetical protein [Galbibacter pacificus]MDG3585292.1 hypothetical protein [Galbibacter pacificus]
MSFKKIIFSVFAVLLLASTLVSCSNDSVADQDALYNNHQGVDKTKIEMPPNG